MATFDSSHVSRAGHVIRSLAERALKLSLLINLVLPGFLFAVAYLLQSSGFLPVKPSLPAGTL